MENIYHIHSYNGKYLSKNYFSDVLLEYNQIYYIGKYLTNKSL